jgi:hypothetical protein
MLGKVSYCKPNLDTTVVEHLKRHHGQFKSKNKIVIKGGTSLSITTLSTMTLSITTLKVMAFSITPLYICAACRV